VAGDHAVREMIDARAIGRCTLEQPALHVLGQTAPRRARFDR
jgi:hypothetical protein